jgi:hypothetical protein
MNSNKRIAATVYSLGTLFVSGIYVQIPCIKEIMTIIIIMQRLIIIIRGTKTLFCSSKFPWAHKRNFFDLYKQFGHSP